MKKVKKHSLDKPFTKEEKKELFFLVDIHNKEVDMINQTMKYSVNIKDEDFGKIKKETCCKCNVKYDDNFEDGNYINEDTSLEKWLCNFCDIALDQVKKFSKHKSWISSISIPQRYHNKFWEIRKIMCNNIKEVA